MLIITIMKKKEFFVIRGLLTDENRAKRARERERGLNGTMGYHVARDEGTWI